MGWDSSRSWKTRSDVIREEKSLLNGNFRHTPNGKWWLCEGNKADGGKIRFIYQLLIKKEEGELWVKRIGLESGPMDVDGLPREWLNDPLVEWDNNTRYPYKAQTEFFEEPTAGEPILWNGQLIRFVRTMEGKRLKYKYVFDNGMRTDKRNVIAGRDLYKRGTACTSLIEKKIVKWP